MRIAYYAPMKSPRSPRPSGDRKIAELFMAALSVAGFDVMLASEYRSWEGRGDFDRQLKIQAEAEAIADKLIEEYTAGAWAPDAWFTYHFHHKAPDWIGPVVCDALDIPYFLAEASIANKQRGGPWDLGFQASVKAIRQATRIFTINPADIEGLGCTRNGTNGIVLLRPFLDQPAVAVEQKHSLRRTLAARMKINPDRYWLLSVAMMRDDSKLESYQQLAHSIENLQRKDWSLLIVGDGPTELMVREFFRFDLDRRVYFMGKRDAAFIHQIMSAADLFVWPAINEAIGMVALEALSSGLPAIWGRSGGIDQIIDDRKNGILIEHPNDQNAPMRFAEAIESLLAEPRKLSAMSNAALSSYNAHHQIETAAKILRSSISSEGI